MKIEDFYDNQYDDYLEDDDLYDGEANQQAYLFKTRKSTKNQEKKHKKTSKPRRQNQKPDNQDFDYDSFFKN